MSIAFFCRARPQDCDAFSIFKDSCHVFIGYPLSRDGATYNPKALRECLVDPTCPDEEWKAVSDRNRNHTRNRNFVREVNNACEDGAIVLIPRPHEGVAHLGLISGQFEIVNAPPWGESYLALRVKQGLDRDDEKCHHIADVAQGWPVVGGYRRIELSRIPGWLRRSTLGLSTYGVFRKPHPIDRDETAYDVLKKVYNGESKIRSTWTLELGEIKCRLVETLTPSSFEHLVVSLLQLKNPTEIWQHTGGPGDGGIDGIGSDEKGNTVGLVQAKFFASQAPEFGKIGRDIRCYAAVLLPECPKPPNDETCLLNLDWIAHAVQRHWQCLPQALAMRVGEPSG